MSASAYSLFQRGSALLSENHPHAAIVLLEQARDLEPGKGSIRETLARAYFRTAHYTRAEAEFSAALEIDPSNDYAHFGLALALERRGRLTEAAGHAKLAVAMKPADENYRKTLERIALAS